MSTAAELSTLADELELQAGISTTANKSPAGYWKRIALASESLAGVSSEANDYLTGYMRRAAVAMSAYTGFPDSTDYNNNEPGYLAWLRAARDYVPPNLVIDGEYNDSANWNEGAGWTVGGGELTAVGLATGYVWQANPNIVADKTYNYSFDILEASAGDVRCYVGGATPVFSPAESTVGTHTGTFTATSGGECGTNSLGGFTGRVDNLIIQEAV